MQFNSLEEFLSYLESIYDNVTTITPDNTKNSKALNFLFRNAMNNKAFNTCFDIIVYANENNILLTKGQ